ncbi:hypothetical protein CUJ83_11125 [Methanocella sp. CWC-04]|uniref:DUF3795 domain-containing protein n=1 Tax=Methanooceanicella nereidis TaxID=2052831 RepID=A0AAP2REW4_9EURY|nr:DUF3795 domain-containing protein [Methanocella sp. CWC-04]MCD1295551.1 hypothetical protein [Methanocella sp. CWC-04]
MDDRQLAGICGLYCGCCIIYRAYHDDDTELTKTIAAGLGIETGKVRCDGCRSENNNCWTGECEFKSCSAKKGVESCAFCDEFPCKTLKKFNKNKSPHHHTSIENLKELKEKGMDKWLADQERKWLCPSCGITHTFYDTECRYCGHNF